MGVIPAQVAGIKKISATVPCPNNQIDPLVLATLDLCGIEKIYKIGGAQAIAALTWGTESVENVDIIIMLRLQLERMSGSFVPSTPSIPNT